MISCINFPLDMRLRKFGIDTIWMEFKLIFTWYCVAHRLRRTVIMTEYGYRNYYFIIWFIAMLLARVVCYIAWPYSRICVWKTKWNSKCPTLSGSSCRLSVFPIRKCYVWMKLDDNWISFWFNIAYTNRVKVEWSSIPTWHFRYWKFGYNLRLFANRVGQSPLNIVTYKNYVLYGLVHRTQAAHNILHMLHSSFHFHSR